MVDRSMALHSIHHQGEEAGASPSDERLPCAKEAREKREKKKETKKKGEIRGHTRGTNDSIGFGGRLKD